MVRVLLAVAMALLLTRSQPSPSLASQQSGWISLFDGRSLAGWTPEQSARWRVLDGAILGDGGGDGWLRTDREFGDFELRIDYRNTSNGNSGIFLRAARATNPADPSNPIGSYELQINNEDPVWATGSIENVIQRLVAVHPRANEWHSYDVGVSGDHLTATLDHVKVLDGHDQRFTSGYVGLQHHRDNKIEFRNIMILPLVRTGR